MSDITEEHFILNYNNTTIAFIRKYSNFLLLSIILILFLYITLVYKRIFPFEWDELSYITRIILKMKAYPVFGRPGYNYFYIFFTGILNSVFNIMPSAYFSIVQFTNMLFGALIIILFYTLIYSTTLSKFAAFISTIFLLFSNQYLLLSTSMYTETMAFFFILLSYTFFFLGNKTRNCILLYISAFCIGYAIEVRETSVAYLLYFVYYLHFKQTSYKSNSVVIFYIVVFVTSIFGYLMLYHFTENYFENVITAFTNQHTISYSNYYNNIFVIIKILADDVVNLSIIFLGIISLIFLYIQKIIKRYSILLILVLSFIIPVLVSLFFVSKNQMDLRYLFSLNFSSAILLAIIINSFKYINIHSNRFRYLIKFIGTMAIILLANKQIDKMKSFKQKSILKSALTQKIYKSLSAKTSFYTGYLYPNIKYLKTINNNHDVKVQLNQYVDFDEIKKDLTQNKNVIFWANGYAVPSFVIQEFRKNYKLINLDSKINLFSVHFK